MRQPTPSAGVHCSGPTSGVTLAGDGARADILGREVVLGAVEGGEARFPVGGRELSCSQGGSLSAGPLTPECTTVAGTASP